MKLNRATPLLFVISALLSFSAKAELSIQITQGIDNPIPIAIVPFSWEGSGHKRYLNLSMRYVRLGVRAERRSQCNRNQQK